MPPVDCLVYPYTHSSRKKISYVLIYFSEERKQVTGLRAFTSFGKTDPFQRPGYFDPCFMLYTMLCYLLSYVIRTCLRIKGYLPIYSIGNLQSLMHHTLTSIRRGPRCLQNVPQNNRQPCILDGQIQPNYVTHPYRTTYIYSKEIDIT